jgi:hypothetical protein
MVFHGETRGVTEITAFDRGDDVFLGGGMAHQALW